MPVIHTFRVMWLCLSGPRSSPCLGTEWSGGGPGGPGAPAAGHGRARQYCAGCGARYRGKWGNLMEVVSTDTQTGERRSTVFRVAEDVDPDEVQRDFEAFLLEHPIQNLQVMGPQQPQVMTQNGHVVDAAALESLPVIPPRM